MKKDQECAPKPTNFEGLRDVLFEEMNLLRSGKVSNARARVVSQLAKRILEATTLDLFAQMKLGEIDDENLKKLTGNNIQ